MFAPAASQSSAPLPQLDVTAGPDTVKILDAGDKLLFSGNRAVDVEAALDRYLRRGAKLVTSLCRVGNSWAAACTIPPSAKNLDDTQTLALADLQSTGSPNLEDELQDGCRVERLGFKRIVYGPSRLAVKLRLEHLKQFGAEMVGEVEEANGEWVAVCDMGSAKNTGYRW